MAPELSYAWRMSAFHPELRLGRFIPSLRLGSVFIALLQRRAERPAKIPRLSDITIEDVPIASGGSSRYMRLYRPKNITARAPALLWSHGGGYLLGRPEQDEVRSIAFVRELGITVAALRYRLAPKYPAPAAVEDAYAALKWVHDNADRLHVDRDRIAVGGASAGGGLSASLAIYAQDRNEVPVAFQLLVYPMIDDRTVLRTDMNTQHVRVWTPKSNRLGWTAYLGHEPGSASASPYAAAARREDLRGLPPAWIGVGSLDLFHDENVAYAKRLNDAGVKCELVVVPGAFHGFDVVFSHKPVSRAFWRAQADALRQALFRIA